MTYLSLACILLGDLEWRTRITGKTGIFEELVLYRIHICQQIYSNLQDALVKTAAFASVATSFLAAGHAQAAVEVANIAAGDSRAGLLFLPLTAALGWVLFNIAGPAGNQINNMKKGVAAGLGLGAASLLATQSADAATEAMQLAAGDSRAGLLFLPLTAALGWVLFNIAGPAGNQIKNMSK